MSYKYLKIAPGLIQGTNELTKDDLVRCKNGGYDYIIDLENGTFFNAEENNWEKIEGDK